MKTAFSPLMQVDSNLSLLIRTSGQTLYAPAMTQEAHSLSVSAKK